MHGAWLKGCRDEVIDSPFLRGWNGGETVYQV